VAEDDFFVAGLGEGFENHGGSGGFVRGTARGLGLETASQFAAKPLLCKKRF
jgi:hypothetical protein